MSENILSPFMQVDSLKKLGVSIKSKRTRKYGHIWIMKVKNDPVPWKFKMYSSFSIEMIKKIAELPYCEKLKIKKEL
jgi:hypothetical protein